MSCCVFNCLQIFTSIKYLRQLMWKSQLLLTAAELEKTPQFCTWLSPTGNWFWSGLQALQYLQTDVIMMTSSLGAYCSGHTISYRAECITISGFFVWLWLWLWCHLGTDSVERHCKTSLSAGRFSCYYAASIFDVLSVCFFADLLHNHIVTFS